MKNNLFFLSPFILLAINLFTHPLAFSLTYYFFAKQPAIVITLAIVLVINILLLAYLSITSLIVLKRKQLSQLNLRTQLTRIQLFIQLILVFYSYILAQKDDAPGLILLFAACLAISFSHYFFTKRGMIH